MIIKLNELKGRKADQGERVTLDDIAVGTGINRATLDNISRGIIKEIRIEYIDALCTYFNISPNDLIEIEPVNLPLALNIRPDRRGARAGTKTKKTPPPTSAEHPPSTPSSAFINAARQRQRDALALPEAAEAERVRDEAGRPARKPKGNRP